MTSRIERLHICAYRGATTELVIEFDPGKPVTMIFGENGTGKSTIVDAIGFVCNGELGSLDNKRLGSGHRKDAYIPALGKTHTDVRVEMQYGGKTFTTGHSPKGAMFDTTTGRPQAHILRRAELLRFVEGDAAARYKEVAKFIDIPGVETAEGALREAVKIAKSEFEEAARAKVQAEEALEQFWAAEGRPGRDALSWTRAETAKDEAGLKTAIGARDVLLTSLAVLRQKTSAYDAAVTEHGVAEERLTEAQKALRAAEQQSDGGRAKLLELLKDARDYLSLLPDADACPVCERPGIESTRLVAQLEERIVALDELDNALRAVDSAQKNLESMLSKSAEAKTALIQTARQAARTFINTDCHEVLNASIAWGTYGKLQDEHSDADDAECMQQAKSLSLELSALTTALQDRRDYEQKRLHQLTAIKQHIVMIDEKTEVLAESGVRSECLEQALGIVETKRKEFIESILDEISADVDALYRKMHPDEGIGNLRMRLAANQKGSLHYGADFGGQCNIQPQAYYSESHLDTLGICVFLALAKRYADTSMIVVLDDVFTSVDQRHLGRIVDTLHDEGDHFNQIIMTTHYRPWRDRYRNARGPGGKIQLLELRPWRIETGIAHDKTQLDTDELRHVLAAHPLDRQSVASKAGVLLESMLDFLALKYRCRIPRLPEPVYTLSELLNSINKQLKKALRIEVLEANGSISSTHELETVLRALEAEAFVRNQVGAHYNVTGASLSDAEVRVFGEHTLTFADLLICSSCGSMPIRDHSGSYWECSCKQKRLHPLHQPK